MNPAAGPARTSGLVVPTSCCRPDRRDLDGKAKVLDAADEAKDLLAFRTAVEVVAAEVLVQSAVLQPVVRSGENRCSDGADRLLRSSAGSHTLELGLKVAALGPCCGPGALDEGGFQPGGALAHAGGSTLTGAFVVPGTQAGPRDQMALGREAVHVDADLGNDDLGAEIADAGDGAQDLDRGAKGLEMGVDRSRHRSTGLRGRAGSQGRRCRAMSLRRHATGARSS